MVRWGVRLAVLALAAGFAIVPGLAAAQAPRAEIFVFSNSRPHITVVDGQTHRVNRTADVPGLASWTWIDDNNYFDGQYLWGGTHNRDNNDVEVVLLDVETLQIAHRIPLGKDAVGFYIGKPSRTGKIFVSKHASAELVVIDPRTRLVERTIKLPVGAGGVACDIDVGIGIDGKERAYIPTLGGNLVLAVDTTTLEVVQTYRDDGDRRPFMLTVTPDGRRLWAQDQRGNSNTILSTVNLQVVERVPQGTVPIVGTFTPDGRLHITGHASDDVIANETETFREVWRTRVGPRTTKVGVHPAGTFVYAIVDREAALAVLETGTGRLVTRISLGTNPTGLYVRRLR